MLAALKTVHEMLVDRGYTIRKGYEYSETDENVQRIADTNVAVVADRKATETYTADSVYVFFAFDAKLGVAKTREFQEIMEENKVKHGILVCTQEPSHKSKEELEAQNVEIFTVLELYKNITRHSLVPKHEVLTPTETNALLKKYGIELKDMPVYDITDPIVKYHAWPVNTVVKITRRFGGTRESEPYYRRVVKL